MGAQVHLVSALNADDVSHLDSDLSVRGMELPNCSRRCFAQPLNHGMLEAPGAQRVCDDFLALDALVCVHCIHLIGFFSSSVPHEALGMRN